MERTIYLQNKDDLMYIAGALVNGVYETNDYERQEKYTDKSTNKCKFDIIFKVQNKTIKDLEAYFMK